MLPSRRHRAGTFDVGVLSTARGFAPISAERIFRHRLVVEDCRKIARPDIAHGLLRVERPPAMDGCAGTWSFGRPPYCCSTGLWPVPAVGDRHEGPVAATDGVNVSSAEKWGLHRSKARADAAPFTASKKQRLSAIDTCTGYCTQQVVPACSTRCKMRPRLEIGATGRDRSTAAQRWLLGRTDVIIALACCYW